MFSNLEELKNEILSGKSNEDIIRERIAYLTSKEYRESRMSTIKRKNTNMVLFYDGFIPPEEAIAFNGGRIADCRYKVDDTSVYEKLINLVRNHMDRKGYNFGFLIGAVRDYYKYDKNSEASELLQYIRECCPGNSHLARETMPYIIYEFMNSSFTGSFRDFGIGYLHHWCRIARTDIPNIDELDDNYFRSVNWEEDKDDDIILPISSIKGAGIAACTEHAILTQNCLSFLGYDTYLLGGELTVEGKGEQHNFNVIRMPSDGRYAIVDSAQIVACKTIEDATNIEDIRNMHDVLLTRSSADATEVSYTSAPEIRTKTLLKQKEEELLRLENDRKNISKAEALIEQPKEGLSIGV